MSHKNRTRNAHVLLRMRIPIVHTVALHNAADDRQTRPEGVAMPDYFI